LKELTDISDALTRYQNRIPILIRDAAHENEAIIIDYVIEDQLFERGVDGNEQTLGEYSPITVSIKQIKGQPTDRITLRDSEDWGRSTYLFIGPGMMEVRTTDDKTGEIFFKYGEEVLKVTDDNIQDFVDEYLRPFLIEAFEINGRV